VPKAVSAREAKTRLGALIGWVREHGDEVIIENRGEPAVVIMSFGEYEKVRALRAQARRREALERLREAKARIGARNRDLTEAEAMALADRAVHEAIDDLAATGAPRFEREIR
jgi:prevent-host-death family protein